MVIEKLTESERLRAQGITDDATQVAINAAANFGKEVRQATVNRMPGGSTYGTGLTFRTEDEKHSFISAAVAELEVRVRTVIDDLRSTL